MDDDFDDLIEDALDVPGPPENELPPPDWGEEPPNPKSQAKQPKRTSIVERWAAVPTALQMEASQASVQPCGLHDLDAGSQLMATVPNEAAMCTPAALLAAQSQPGGHEVRTIDLAAELMAMETTGGQSQASNPFAPTGKRPREFAEPEELSIDVEQPPKAVRQFRPLASHNAAMVPTPEFVKQERLAAQPKPAEQQGPARPVRDNHVFRSLNAAQIGGSRCILIRGTSATDSVYCRMRPLGQPPKWWQASQRASTGLLGESIHTLLHKLEDEDLNRTREALQSLQDGGPLAPSGAENERVGTQGAQAVTARADDAGGPLLWVARHAPRSYLQLLSEEFVNASVLRWLKSWDPVVFGSPEGKSKDPEAGMVRSCAQSLNQHTVLKHKLLAAAKGTDDRRPQIKGILLSGPPGVGKTTLAHVVARHCGYRVVEINASDERSRGALLGAINSAVQMQAVLGEKRPNCLVIDEIDGALGDGSSGGASGVRELANILKTGHIASTDKDTSGDGSGGRKGKGSTALMRPIICVCNDLYTPALRPLREAAEVVEVMPPQPRMLQARLREVCNRESAAVQETALKALASKAAGDVRSCINTLQLLTARHELVTGTHVSEVSVGDKDMTSAPFAVWDNLLSSRSTRPPDMLAHLMSFGEHDLIMHGVHENMLEVPYMDQDLGRTAAMCDWMCDYDVFNSKIFRKQHFQLMHQLPVATLATASLCQTHSKMRLRWPKTGTAVTKRANVNRSAVADWLTTLPAPVATFSMTSAALDIAPTLAAALSPPQETLDGLLLGKPKDPAAVQALVDLMLDYRVVYDIGSGQQPPGSAEPVSEGTPLKPALHSLHAYSSSWLNPKTKLSEAVRSMLLHKRQMHETARQEERAAEKAAELCQHTGVVNDDEAAMDAMDSQVHDERGAMQTDASDSPEAGTHAVAAPSVNNKVGGGLRSFCKVPEKKKPAASKQRDGASASGSAQGVSDKGSKGHGDKQQETQSTQVRGAAGQAAAAIRGAKAPKALVNAKANWLTSMGSKVMKEKQRRVLVAEGEELKLPEGVTASQATGKLHFAVTFKFNEGYTNAVKRPLRMYDVFPGMAAAQ